MLLSSNPTHRFLVQGPCLVITNKMFCSNTRCLSMTIFWPHLISCPYHLRLYKYKFRQINKFHFRFYLWMFLPLDKGWHWVQWIPLNSMRTTAEQIWFGSDRGTLLGGIVTRIRYRFRLWWKYQTHIRAQAWTINMNWAGA